MKKIVICTIVTLSFLYVVLIMPMPFVKSLWDSHNYRDKMISAVTRKVIGLSKDEIIALLGESEGGEGHFTAPGRGLYYVIGTEKGGVVNIKIDVFVVYLDENFIAVECGIMKG